MSDPVSGSHEAGSGGEENTWRSITGDGGLRLRTCRPGSGDTPGLHAVCLAHCKGKIVGEDEHFLDSKAEGRGDPLNLVAGRDCGVRDRALHLAVQHMRVGEVAEVQADPAYAFGERGSFSFPSVPPHATIVYEVELLSATAPQDKDRKDMFFEERLEAAHRVRLKANSLFASGDIPQALGQYELALTYVDDDLMLQLEGPFLRQAGEVAALIHVNITACHLRLEGWVGAVAAASDALKHVPEDNKHVRAKALFRRGRARRALQQSEEAEADLRAAQALCPDDKSIEKELVGVSGDIKAQRKAVDSLFRNKLRARQRSSVVDQNATEPRPVHIPAASVMEKVFHALGDIFKQLLMPLWRWIGWEPGDA